LIVSVTKKDGTSKAGKAYTKYTVTDSRRKEYATFSDTLAKQAIRCREQRIPVVLDFDVKDPKFAPDLTKITEQPREPGQEG
jgi:hypothetical protein